MNKDFFKTNYSKHITSAVNNDLLFNDGYAYARYLFKNRPLLVLDDVSNTHIENDDMFYSYSNNDKIKVVDFLDSGIMELKFLIISGIFKEIELVSSLSGKISDRYNMDRFNFEIKEISKEEIIKNLRKVFYVLQPMLQCRTLMGGGKSNSSSDPNYYSGYYYLQDGKEYTILKHINIIEFYKGHKEYTHLFKSIEERTDCIYREEIDFKIYNLSIEYINLKNMCNTYISELIDYNRYKLSKTIRRINELKLELIDILN